MCEFARAWMPQLTKSLHGSIVPRVGWIMLVARFLGAFGWVAAFAITEKDSSPAFQIGDSNHGLPEVPGHFQQTLGVVEMCDSLYARLGTFDWITTLEDSRADEDTVQAELHHESSIRWSRDATSGKVDHWEASKALDLLHQRHGSAHVLGIGENFDVVHCLEAPNLTVDGTSVAHGFYDIARAGLALGTDHCRALSDTPQRLAKVPAAADKRHLELGLVDHHSIIKACHRPYRLRHEVG